MNKLLLASVFMLLFSASYGQRPTFRATIFNPNVYRTLVDMKLTRISDKQGRPLPNDDTSTYTLKKRKIGVDYRVISEDDNGYMVIRILPKVKIKDTTIEVTQDPLLKTDSNNASNYLFSIKNDDLVPLSKSLLTTKIVGTALIHPFKLRTSAANSGAQVFTDITVGYTFGLSVKLGRNPLRPNYFTFVPVGFGVGESEYVYQTKDGDLSEAKDGVSITYYSWGFMFTLNKVNLGIFNGFDAMIDKRNNWIYQGKPWFSFGIGYKFDKD